MGKVFMFSYNMTFGKGGHHRGHRSGGQYSRRNGELFINTYMGKLGEFGLHEYFTGKGFELEEPDLEKWGIGIWDDQDLTVNSKKLSVKGVAHFSQLLLLETKDWDSQGRYLPNLGKGTSESDYLILTRVTDGKSLMKRNRLMYSDEVKKVDLAAVLFAQRWEFDIAGFITIEEKQEIVEKGTNVRVTLFGSYLEIPDLVFMGSHDFVIDHLFRFFKKKFPQFKVKIIYVGSSSGLSALHNSECDITGIHLLDESTKTYNKKFIEEYGLTASTIQVKGYKRKQGLYLAHEFENKINSLEDLVFSGLTFLNRNKGSGTRIWFDLYLNQLALKRKVPLSKIKDNMKPLLSG